MHLVVNSCIYYLSILCTFHNVPFAFLISLHMYYYLKSKKLTCTIKTRMGRTSCKSNATYCHRGGAESIVKPGTARWNVVICRVNHMVMIFCPTLQCIAKTISRVIQKTGHVASECNVNIIRDWESYNDIGKLYTSVYFLQYFVLAAGLLLDINIIDIIVSLTIQFRYKLRSKLVILMIKYSIFL